MARQSALCVFLRMALWARGEEWGALVWVHDLALRVAECEPQAGAGQAGSIDTAFVWVCCETTAYVLSWVRVNAHIVLVFA